MATVEGYPGHSSVRAGQMLAFHLGATNGVAGPRTFGVDRVRPAGGAPATATFSASVVVQTPATPAWEGYGWSPTYSFSVPATWPSGLYRVYEGPDTLFDFVVRPRTPGSTSRILFQVGTNTPHAYSTKGGRSFYSSPRAQRVSYDRPGHGYRQGEPFLQWLEAQGIAVEFCSSQDLHELPAMLDSYDLLIVVEHDEYWSKEMRDHVDRFVRNGGNVAVFSGNTCYRQVRFEGGGPTDPAGTPNHRMACYKFPAAEPVADRDRASVAMASPPVCRPTPLTLGAGFSHGAGCWHDGSVMASASFAVRFRDHWAFQGVTASTIANGLVGYETDAVAYADEPEGYPRVTGEDGAPPTCTVLATADLRHWGPNGKAGMATISLLVRNGMVFNAASVSWQDGLASNPDVQRVTRNVIDRLRTRQRWTVWEHIGHANDVWAMTACENKLWCATADNRLWRRYPMGADAVWKPVGHANQVRAMASAGGRLWCITGDNRVWRRAPVETDIPWEYVGIGPPTGSRAFAATTFLLYVLDPAGLLWMSAARTPLFWQAVPAMGAVRESRIACMAAYEDILYAATSDGRLLRTQPDLVYESTSWADVHHCNFACGLAVVDAMLFVATSENRLWWLDLRAVVAP